MDCILKFCLLFILKLFAAVKLELTVETWPLKRWQFSIQRNVLAHTAESWNRLDFFKFSFGIINTSRETSPGPVWEYKDMVAQVWEDSERQGKTVALSDVRRKTP